MAHAWLNPERRCHRLIASEAGASKFQAILERSTALPRPPLTVKPRAYLDRLSGGEPHQGLILEVESFSRPDFKEFFTSRPEAYRDVILLDQVTDPHNVGAIIRSAAVFDCMAVIVPRHHAPEVTTSIAKSACGAVEYIPMVAVSNLSYALRFLHELGYESVGLDEHATTSLYRIPFSPLTAFVFGAEGRGTRPLTARQCSHLARIPSDGDIKTLNVSTSVAIALYEKQRSLQKDTALP